MLTLNRSWSYFIVCACMVLLLIASSFCHATIIDFEGLSDGAVVTTQYPGISFFDSTILQAGAGLNEFEYPPHSGVNVVFDDGGYIRIDFDSPISIFSAYFTYSQALLITAFDATGGLLGHSTSLFVNNLALSGDPGSLANDLLAVSANGIRTIKIEGDPSGGSFVMDDISFQPQASVPEPDTVLLVLAGFLSLFTSRVRWRNY